MATFDRPGAHRFLADPDVLGETAPAESTLPQLPIPYTIGANGRASYTTEDLLAYANAVKARAVRRMGGRRRRRLDLAPTDSTAA